MRILYVLSLASLCLGTVFAAYAEEAGPVLVIKDHQFSPTEITLPANTRTTITVKNQDPTPEEFESEDFDVEKIIPGNSEAIIKVPALKPGTYHFIGDFHKKSAQGTITVK